MSAQQRSLLSERLHSNLKDVVAFQAHDDASMSEDDDCFDDTDDGCTFGSPSESWSWLDAQDNTHSCVSKDSDRSSHTSQPIAIPARWAAAAVQPPPMLCWEWKCSTFVFLRLTGH